MAKDNQLLEDLQEQIELQESIIDGLKSRMDKGEQATFLDEIDKKISLLDDPYDIQSPLEIIGEIPPDDAHPQGQMLGWKNPVYRDRRGWRGWIPLEWGDQYTGDKGEKLKEYLVDPPEAWVMPDKIDSYVRRGDVLLGRIRKEIFVSRQLKAELECAKRRGALSDAQEQIIGEGIKIVGAGMQKDKQPRQIEKRTGAQTRRAEKHGGAHPGTSSQFKEGE